jgi:hypothetical protein
MKDNKPVAETSLSFILGLTGLLTGSIRPMLDPKRSQLRKCDFVPTSVTQFEDFEELIRKAFVQMTFQDGFLRPKMSGSSMRRILL